MLGWLLVTAYFWILVCVFHVSLFSLFWFLVNKDRLRQAALLFRRRLASLPSVLFNKDIFDYATLRQAGLLERGTFIVVVAFHFIGVICGCVWNGLLWYSETWRNERRTQAFTEFVLGSTVLFVFLGVLIVFTVFLEDVKARWLKWISPLLGIAGFGSIILGFLDNIPLRLRAVWPPCMLALLIATLGFMMHILRKAYLNAKMLRSNCLRLRMLYWVCMLSMLVKLATWFVLVVVLGVHWEHLESSNFEDISFLVFMACIVFQLLVSCIGHGITICHFCRSLRGAPESLGASQAFDSVENGSIYTNRSVDGSRIESESL